MIETVRRAIKAALSVMLPPPSRHGYFIWRGDRFVPDTRRRP